MPVPDVNRNSTGSYHTAVLLQETIDGLSIRPGGTYVDCTYGGGGHSRAILEKLNDKGRLFVFDQDETVREHLSGDARIQLIPQNFRHLQRFLKLYKQPGVDGILADLGVSSHQFDEPARGFSIRYDADLDMRMDTRTKMTAADILNNYSELQLHKLFERYGEVANAKSLAKIIVSKRMITPVTTINQFKQVIYELVKGNPNKYLAQVFQALRIEVNEEITVLKELLEQSVQVLNKEGRIVIITFHSLEDRVVKNFFKTGSFNETIADEYGSRPANQFTVITKKPIIAGERELKQNPRSRSAKLRIAEKINCLYMPEKNVSNSLPYKGDWKKAFNYRFIVRNIPFFLFLSAIAVLYIFNGHYADKLIRKIAASEKNIKELQYEYKTVQSEVIFRSKASELVKAVEPLGLRELKSPPLQLSDSSIK